jgi:putative ABC transport system permease protein
MNLATLALRNLRRRPGRTAVLVLSVGLAVATALALVALSAGIENSVSKAVDERGADATVSQRETSDVLSGFVPDSLEARLRAVADVIGVAGELAMFAPVERNQQMLILGWSEASFFWPRMPLRDGRRPQPAEGRVALLGPGAAERLNKRVGDVINVFDEAFRVIGITDYASVFNRGLIIVPLRDLQEVGFRQNQVTMFHLEFRRNAPAGKFDRIKSQIEQFGRVLVTPTDQLLRHDRNLAVQKAISRAVSIIALVMGSLSVFSALLTAIQERAREIGIMMAIGWSNRRIMISIVIEGFLVGLIGAIIGIPMGFAASQTLSGLPTIGAYFSFQPTSDMILPSFGFTTLLCILGSIYPAWRATLHAPAEALRRP